jgi:hypothetical protein
MTVEARLPAKASGPPPVIKLTHRNRGQARCYRGRGKTYVGSIHTNEANRPVRAPRR